MIKFYLQKNISSLFCIEDMILFFNSTKSSPPYFLFHLYFQMCARYYVVAMGYMVGVAATASMDGKAVNVMWLKPNVFIKAVMVMVDAGKEFAFVLLVGQGKGAKQVSF